jgi:hypothetical protein
MAAVGGIEDQVFEELQKNYMGLKEYLQCGELYILTFPIFILYKLERIIKNIWKPH